MGDGRPLTVVFFQMTMRGGGSERTMVNLLTHVSRRKFRLVLVLSSAVGPFRALVPGDVTVINLASRHVYASVISLARVLRRVRPQVVFSNQWPANIVATLARQLAAMQAPVVLRETNHQTESEVGIPFPFSHLVRYAYRKAAKVVCLSRGVEADVRQRYGLSSDQVVTVYNPVDVEGIAVQAGEPVPAMPIDRFKIVAAGRMVRQKGFDLLLEAVASIQDVPWHLTILGEGRERATLAVLADRLGVRNRLLMPGFQQNPYAWMARADLFVLSSRWEGFGHAIAEAMACGVPVLATRCRSGPDEIITDGVDGRLCAPRSIADLARMIRCLAHHPEERRVLAEKARETVKRFDATGIVGEYERVLLAAVNGRRSGPGGWRSNGRV